MDKRIAATLAVTVVAIMAMTGIGYSLSAMTYNTGNSAVNEYVVLNFGSYSFGDGDLRYSTVSTPADFTFAVTSSENDVNTVITLTMRSCSSLYAGEHLVLWLRVFTDGATHTVRADLTVTDRAADKSLTVVHDTVSNTGNIGAASSDSTFAFTLTVTGLTSRASVSDYRITVMRTVYEVGGGDSVGTYGGSAHKGYAVGTDTMTARHAGSDDSMIVTLKTPVTGQFQDLRNTGWVYAVSMQLASGQTSSETWDQTPQYAYYDGDPSGTWTYAANGGLKLTDEKTYDITLYIAAKTTDGGFGSPFRPADDIIAGGIIQFTFDSSN
ncbi:adhesin-like protein [methanogenic archaeon ISO4-H5]|nr:adhesin-like protein [methanogenic archaeon ISO4-H5]